MNKKEKDALNNLSLSEKIEKSKNIIKDALFKFNYNEHYLAWTGGKDSTTMLWLYREAAKEIGKPLPRAMFIDEGHVFDEIMELVNKIKSDWGVEVVVIKNTDVSDKAQSVGDIIRVADLNKRNRKELVKIGFNEDVFAFEPESFAGNHLMKTVAMNMFLEESGIKALSTAIRWDEQESRLEEVFFSPRSNPDHVRVHPVLHFKERDIWNTIQNNDIPFCSLYYQGYRSLGAKGSTTKFSDIPAWEQDLENTTERDGRGQEKEGIMEQLRALGYM
jgi:phosphoadenosine phosphosulfate reductase